jgi:hypothetical protein
MRTEAYALKDNISCFVLPITIGYDDCWGITLVGGAGDERSCGW